MELLVLLIILIAVFLYVMVRGALDEKSRKKKYRRQLKELYGSFPDRTYSAEELDKISRYYWHKREASSHDIDEITWNDLGMDSIFARMNFTQSSSGEEYLYAMLRQPVTDDRDGAKAQMSAQIEYMMEHEKERLDTMMSLKELGYTGKYSLSDYLDYLDELGVRSSKVHYGCILLLLVSAAVLFVRTSLGVPMLIGTACFNIVTYMKEKGIAAPYVTTFAYIIRLLHCADKIAGHSLGPEMENYVAGLKAKRSGFKDFEKHSGHTHRPRHCRWHRSRGPAGRWHHRSWTC